MEQSKKEQGSQEQYWRLDSALSELAVDDPMEIQSEGVALLGKWISLSFALLSVANAAFGDPWQIRGALLAMWLSGYGFAEWLRGKGKAVGSTWVLAGTGFSVIATMQCLSGGLSSPNVGGLILVVMVAGIIGGLRLALVLCALCVADVGLFAAGELMGWEAPVLIGRGIWAMAGQQVALLVFAGLGVGVAIRRLRRSVDSAKAQQNRALDAVDSFKALFVKSPAPMGLTETNLRPGEQVRRAVAVNEAFLSLFGVDGKSALLIPGAQIKIWREMDQLMQVRDLLSKEGSVERFRALMRTYDGTGELVCLASAKPVAWEGVQSVLWTFQDITENERLRGDLEAINVELEARVEGKAQELAVARKELERRERLANLGELVAGVAHEINTPLGNALLAVSTLDDPAKRLSELSLGSSISRAELARSAKKVGEARDLALENLTRAADVIRNFKQLSADQAGQTRREFDIEAVLSGCLKVMGPAFKAKSASWSVEASALARSSLADGYPGSLSQIATIMASNALSHAFDSATPSPGEPKREFRIEVDIPRAGWIGVSFIDNGAGLGDGVGAKVFEPFFTTKAGRGGTGLGLAIAWNLAREALGGELALGTAATHGCRFDLLIPLVAPLAGPAA